MVAMLKLTSAYMLLLESSQTPTVLLAVPVMFNVFPSILSGVAVEPILFARAIAEVFNSIPTDDRPEAVMLLVSKY